MPPVPGPWRLGSGPGCTPEAPKITNASSTGDDAMGPHPTPGRLPLGFHLQKALRKPHTPSRCQLPGFREMLTSTSTPSPMPPPPACPPTSHPPISLQPPHVHPFHAPIIPPVPHPTPTPTPPVSTPTSSPPRPQPSPFSCLERKHSTLRTPSSHPQTSRLLQASGHRLVTSSPRHSSHPPPMPPPSQADRAPLPSGSLPAHQPQVPHHSPCPVLSLLPSVSPSVHQ